MNKIYYLLFFLFTFFFPLEAKNYSLTPKKVKYIFEETLSKHLYQKEMNEDIMKKTISLFFSYIDHSKTLFLKEEVDPYINMNPYLLNKSLNEYRNGSFELFFAIGDQLLQNIKRKLELEKQLDLTHLLTIDEDSVYKMYEWPSDLEDIKKKTESIYRSIKKTLIFQDDMTQKMKKAIDKSKSSEMKWLAMSQKERESELLEYFLSAACQALDTHTVYCGDATDDQDSPSGSFTGLGIEVKYLYDHLFIKNVMIPVQPNFPTPFLVHDKIIAIEGRYILDLSNREISELLKGRVGSSLKLTIMREIKNDSLSEKQLLNIRAYRQKFLLDTHYKKDLSEGKVGVIKLSSFHSSAYKNIKEALTDLKKDRELKAVLLDLRDNNGGYLNEAVKVSGLFIKSGALGALLNKKQELSILRSFSMEPFWDGPLIIFINKKSASASEFVAQTLQDYGRAIIVGDKRSFGKGVGQTVLDSVKITNFNFYTVSGKSPQLVGVLSDIVIPTSTSQKKIGQKYGEYPLPNTTINPLFDDNLSDLTSFTQEKYLSFYRNAKQEKIYDYQALIPLLREKSLARLDQKIKPYEELEEAFCIMNDMILNLPFTNGKVY
ncbi:MAG: S41 family peptidase [Rhabdochlamydiaceae bacterium]